MISTRALSYLLCAALAVAVVWLHLGPAALGGLLAYTVLDLSHRRATKWTGMANLRWAAVLTLAIAAVAAGWTIVYSARNALRTLPRLLEDLMPQVTAIADRYEITLPFDGTDQLRAMLVTALTENVNAVGATGGHLTESVFHVVLGVFVAVFAFTAPTSTEPPGDTFGDQLWAEFSDRIRGFMLSFELVFGAQLAISAINATLTGIYLLAFGFPNFGFLVAATFLLGLLPIIGNVASNTLVVGTALTMSLERAIFSLVFLVVIHKLEYFLNSRIVGGSIRLPMWMTLLGILVGEAVLGVPGIVIAPAVIHYVREELRRR